MADCAEAGCIDSRTGNGEPTPVLASDAEIELAN